MAIKIIRRPAAAPAPAPVVPDALVARERSEKFTPERPLDGMCRAAIGMAPMSIVPWFLMASYLYYVHDVSLLSDGCYDQLGREIAADWDIIRHDHKHLITEAHLSAGSMFDLRPDQYPLRTRAAAAHLARGEWGMAIDIYRGCEPKEGT